MKEEGLYMAKIERVINRDFDQLLSTIEDLSLIHILSFPNMMLEAVTNAKQKTIVTAIFTIYTNAWYSFSFIVLLFFSRLLEPA